MGLLHLLMPGGKEGGSVPSICAVAGLLGGRPVSVVAFIILLL